MFDDSKSPDLEWLIDHTEKFCKDKAIYNAILESIHIIDGKSKDKDVGSLPKMLSDALAVSFDTHIGHDYIEDYGKRYEFYHRVENKIPFDIEQFNTITNGGVPRKTLNIIMAGTGVGKSLFMCHHASACLTQNLDVLYITCEMAEERIAERIDANLMDLPMEDLKKLPADLYNKKMQQIRKKYTGRLIIKEYPTATANANHFRALLNDLKMKKNFQPDIIFIDYLNICASARLKMNASVNSYTFVKAIAEELRGLAVEFEVPIFSATQVNRGGFNNTDVGLENTSESFGLPATADLMFALISTEELEEQGQVMVKQLKNRYNDVSRSKKFVVGIDRSKMKLFDVDSPIVGDEGFGKSEDGVKNNGKGNGVPSANDKYDDWNFD
jgi:archaellum biogenesis ATPase FlaH